MDPPPPPPPSDLFDEIDNFDFDTSSMDALFSLNRSPVNPQLSLNTHIPTSTQAPAILLQPNANVSVDNIGPGLGDPVATGDQIQDFTRSPSCPINYQPIHSVSQSFQGIPKGKELAPQMIFQDSLLGQANYFPGQNPHQPTLPPYFTSPIISNMNQIPPSPSTGLNFSMDTSQPPLPQFASQTVPANYADHQPSNYCILKHQLPRQEYTPPPVSVSVSSGNNFVATMDDILCHDPEGVACFLAGIVRPGPDCSIYKCSTCSVEFPNAQAFGGHMKSHAKRKIDETGDGKAQGERLKGSASSKGKKTKASKKKSSKSEEDN